VRKAAQYRSACESPVDALFCPTEVDRLTRFFRLSGDCLPVLGSPSLAPQDRHGSLCGTPRACRSRQRREFSATRFEDGFAVEGVDFALRMFHEASIAPHHSESRAIAIQIEREFRPP
jgi:hypothetical protein